MSRPPKEEIRTCLLTIESLIEVQRNGCECAELRTLARMSERLRAGLNQYGRLDNARGRDWVVETLNETLDACVYVTRELERLNG